MLFVFERVVVAAVGTLHGGAGGCLVHMPLHDVSVEQGVRPHAAFDVHPVARPEQAEVGFDECFVYGGHRIGVVRNGFHGQADAVVGDALVYPELFGYLAPHGEGLVLSIFPDVRDGGHPLYYP